MIPFQTLLALLAVLLMFGCSQEKPPKARTAVNGQLGNGQTANPSPSPRNTIAPNPDVIVKPSKKDPNQTVLQLNATVDASNPSLLKFDLSGNDARMLYLWSEIKPVEGAPDSMGLKRSVKSGHHYQCGLSQYGLFDCSWTLDLKNGELSVLVDTAQVQSGPEHAVDPPKERTPGLYFSFQQNPTPDAKDPTKSLVTPYFKVEIKFGYAQKLYRSLLTTDLTGEKPNPYNVDQMRKFGKYLDCVRDVKVKDVHLSDTDDKAYTCWMYGNLSTGSFTPIDP